MYAFLNGQKLAVTSGSENNTTNITNTTGVMSMVGGFPGFSSPVCYVDDVEVYKGLALHTESFTPPNQPAPNYKTIP
jgi:hypothetical protein